MSVEDLHRFDDVVMGDIGHLFLGVGGALTVPAHRRGVGIGTIVEFDPLSRQSGMMRQHQT